MDDIDKKRREYFEAEIEKLKGHSHVPFKSLHHVTDPDRGDTWQIGLLRQGLDNSAIAEELASHFTKITNEFAPLDFNHLPSTFRDTFPPTTPEYVAEWIRSSKKPLSDS